MASNDRVRELEEELRQKQAALDAATAAATAAAQSQTVVMRREFRLAKFSGDGEPEIDEWAADVERALAAARLNPDEQVVFVLEHITGTAKREIRLRPSYLTSTVSQILDILKSRFGAVTGPYEDVIESFFGKKQGPRETLQEFSLALAAMMERVKLEDSGMAATADSLLKKRFVAGMRDQTHAPLLKTLMAENPRASFWEFRETAIHTLGGYQMSHPSIREAVVQQQHQTRRVTEEEVSLKDVMRLLKKQQEQLDSLLANRKRQRPATTTFRGRCYDCGVVGHKRGSRDCIKAKKPLDSQKALN